jgi:DNA-binding transcriptional LysR family regulator
MELRHLRYFVALAEELSFTRAAQRLHISQPPLSMQISQLEEEVGVALLARTSRRVELTAAGQAFLNDARSILDRVEAARSRARAIGNGHAGRIEIGLSGSHFQGPLPTMIAAYMQNHPEVSVVLHELKPATQLEELRSGHIDLSISRTPVDDAGLTSTLLWDDPLFAALPRGHALGKRKRLSLRDLRNERFVMLRLDSSAYAQHTYDCCVQAGFAPNIVQLVLEVPAIVSLVAAGIGVGLIPRSVGHMGASAIDAVPLGPDAPNSGVYVVQRRNDASNVIDEFVRMLTGDIKGPEGPDKKPNKGRSRRAPVR